MSKRFEKKYKRLSAAQADLRGGQVSCQSLVAYYLERIAAHAHLNAFLEVFAEEAQAKAKQIDAKLASGEPLGRLFGMVIGIKDVLCYEGHAVSAASHILSDFQSLFSATAIQRLLEEDAIIIGRLNCDEFAMGSTNEYSAFGPTLNAYDNNRVPGGSSGASAVAVQADLCLAALGSDTGGSVRQPASFCDVIGMKPTYGRISRHGLIAYASSFDQIGTLTNSISDAALLLEIMSGKDEFDSTVSPLSVPTYTDLTEEDKSYQIAYFPNVLEHDGLDPEIRQQINECIEQLKEEGHELVPIEFPYLEYIVPTYYILTTAEASSNLARYDGVHYGYSVERATNMEDNYRQTRSKGFGNEVKRRIMLGTFVLSSGYYDAYYKKGQQVRRLIHDFTRKILTESDFILTPTTPTTAFELNAKSSQNPTSVYLADIYTVQANLAGLPAISLPLFEHSADQMPFGLQLMADKFEEHKLLKFANYLMSDSIS